MPFSQTYPMCCINIRNFVDQFYQFTDGVAQHHVDIDEVLRKVSGLLLVRRRRKPELTRAQSLDGLLSDHVAATVGNRLKGMSNLSQIAQVVINLEHFATACEELEGVLMNLR
jgi:ABC-type transporter Mla subunit MlaD